MRRRIYICVFLFNISLLMFLTSPVFSAQEKNTNKESREVEVISNPKLPIYKDGIKLRIVFKEELSIGQIEGDENYMFFAGISLNTDENGNFYVTDHDRKSILKYNPEGNFILSIGRKGQGPGEFQSMSVARFDKDGFLYVTDSSNRRISFFNKNGEFIRQIPLSERLIDLYINSDGNYVRGSLD